ncbi:YcgL domain-containing protein [Halomonas sp. DP4Y7-1]|nr:YcgL domain-containing protein [Halomonas litopenaei]MBY5925683.1 YcgL domain-containing protein [Halomonas sp. DP4Y7-2]MBY5969279.1 YcgL domain-containing protein [Halomonas denitrificans]MBY5984906.1 YcgL domain-containing protein [Halomonas sp. DP5Y7-2]MBY6030592.1 YcgL domain-containing protein [Halomonas sp. DP8Y7-1]MBY6232498.1 YcgL domain-containing protein [Halomonas sp. DP4Y7-1]
MQGKLLCEVFKSSRKEEMYLYVDKRQGLERIPEPLLERFGAPVSVMTMILTPEKTLARTSGADVMAAIEEKGFYLQMPPAKDEYLLDLYRTPTEARY